MNQNDIHEIFLPNSSSWTEKTEVWGYSHKTTPGKPWHGVIPPGGRLSSCFKSSRSWRWNSFVRFCRLVWFSQFGSDEIPSRGSSPGWVQPNHLFIWCSSMLWKYRRQYAKVWMVDVYVVAAGFKDLLELPHFPWKNRIWVWGMWFPDLRTADSPTMQLLAAGSSVGGRLFSGKPTQPRSLSGTITTLTHCLPRWHTPGTIALVHISV